MTASPRPKGGRLRAHAASSASETRRPLGASAWPYAAVVFTSAFLLFEVQLIMGKYVLPWFGGTPGVWTACLLVFQFLLLAGYAYSHLLATRVPAAAQAATHVGVLGVSVLLLGVAAFVWPSPILPGAAWKPAAADSPEWSIVRLLVAAVGLPFILLSTTAPLVQRWFSLRFPGVSPYRLYAVSNLGSLLGLVAYPFVVERALRVQTQGKVWFAGYCLFAGLVAACAPLRRGVASEPPRPAEAARPPSAGRCALWVALSATASTMLLAITNHVCQELAVVPLLWVVPLVLYLLSFILCFQGERWYPRAWCHALYAAAGVLMVGFHFTDFGLTMKGQIAAFLLTLFVCCMVCHGELYRLRPAAAHLTLFYLLLAVGGAAGGLFVSIVAPRVFPGYWEMPIGVVATGALLLGILWTEMSSWLHHWRPLRIGVAALLLAGAATLAQQTATRDLRALWVGRNFYGVLSMRRFLHPDPNEDAYMLHHGRTMHGLQFATAARQRLATGYYRAESGIGRAVRSHPRLGSGLRLGVIGLGIGSLAAYGQPGDAVRFYEINPAVIDVAQGRHGYFSMLAASRAQVTVVPGDARLVLEREAERGERQGFDILAVDAFNSDAIPVHLVTREALQLYLLHLREADSLLAFHITNRSVDLGPVLARLAEAEGLHAVRIHSADVGPLEPGSAWVLLCRSEAPLRRTEIAEASMALAAGSAPLWTDDYSNVVPLLNH